MSQQFCLKWNNHTTNMLQVFENLLTTEALVDVTLACDGLSLKAHKMVLSACSPFFQSLFLENPCKHPIVIMKDMRYCDLKAIIDFMYRGEVNVSHDQLSALLKTAETLKVKGLAEVTGENKHASGIVQQEIIQQNASTPTPVPPSAQRTDTPPLQGKRKRGRPRKRSLSDSNRSDDEGIPAKIKEPNSDIEELSGDASMEATSDTRSGGGPISSNSQSQVPIHSSNNVNTFSKSHLSSSQDPQVEEPASGDENEFEVEPSKLLEQTLTTENVPSNSQNSTGHITLPSVSGLEISRRSMSSTDSVSQALVPVSDSLGSNLQGPDSPQDVKPQILSFDDPPISPVAGTSHGSADRSLMMYMDQSGVASIPGPSNFQDNSALVPHDSQPQGNLPVNYKLPAVAYMGRNELVEIDQVFDLLLEKQPILPLSENEFSDKNVKELLVGKINFLIGKIKSLEEKLDDVAKNSNESHATATFVSSDIMKEFPMKDQRKLYEIEDYISDDEKRKSLVFTLKGIGGTTVQHVITNILKMTFKNELAELYSYAGAKEKLPFKRLDFCKVILDTTRLHFPQTTEDQFGNIVAKWLVHAKQRREREQKFNRFAPEI